VSTLRKSAAAEATILIASESLSDANLVKKLLSQELDRFVVSTDPDRAAEDFDKHPPQVLVLAFNTMSKAESYYLGLYRLSEKVHQHPHRTIILCNKDEVNRAYHACKKEHFDDYVLFWPMTNDAPRLLMTVHHALRDLSAATRDEPSSAEFANQVRRLSQLGSMLDRQMQQGTQHIDSIGHSILRAEQEINAALEGFSEKLVRGELPDLPDGENLAALEHEIKRLRQEEIGQRIRAASEMIQPAKQWANEFKQHYAPHIESVRALNAMADRIRPLILVVDDDEFQRKIVNEYLVQEGYRLEFVSGGIEALNVLRKIRPDLILMDIVMSDLDGIETTRRLKAIPQFTNVPVIMMTGKSEGGSVRDSIKAGAKNFVVKPFDRATLAAKVFDALKAE